MKEYVHRMSTMIDQLLWLARSRDVSFNLVAVDMSQVVDAAFARFRDVIDSRHIAIEVDSCLPTVMGHGQWIEEVFANLISNAIKYMGENNPHPKIAVRAVQMNGRVRYEVRDTGVGIAPKDQARLFEMFTRLHTVDAEGLGLGLSIVHRIVTKLHGQVGVESQLGEGSTFWFSLMAAEAEPQLTT
jgi:signal transduction histidine kinase